jgi:hypothetical protein
VLACPPGCNQSPMGQPPGAQARSSRRQTSPDAPKRRNPPRSSRTRPPMGKHNQDTNTSHAHGRARLVEPHLVSLPRARHLLHAVAFVRPAATKAGGGASHKHCCGVLCSAYPNISSRLVSCHAMSCHVVAKPPHLSLLRGPPGAHLVSCCVCFMP